MAISVKKLYFIYILANINRNVIYIGVTNNLIKRVWEHKNNLVDGFTKKYRVHDLIYYEIFDDIKTAITREKQLKSWSRKRKNKLIASKNPKLIDLYKNLIQ